MQHIRAVDFIEFSTIYNRYLTEDFPPAEVKPLFVIEKAYAAGKYAAYVMEDTNHQVKAYASFMWHREEIQLLDYFAVTREAGRGAGTGSTFLRSLVQSVKAKGFLMECESPEKAGSEPEKILREKRIAFYVKNGAVKTGVRAEVFGVDFQLLYMPIGSGMHDIPVAEAFRDIYLNISGETLFRKHVRITTDSDMR